MSDSPDAVSIPAVVLDTNAVLDWLVFEDPRIEPLARAIESGRLLWLATPAMRRELSGVLLRPNLADRNGGCERTLTNFDGRAKLCGEPPRAPPGLVCADTSDQVFVDLAVAAQARWLITRDRAVLALRRRALGVGLSIAPPENWHHG